MIKAVVLNNKPKQRRVAQVPRHKTLQRNKQIRSGSVTTKQDSVRTSMGTFPFFPFSAPSFAFIFSFSFSLLLPNSVEAVKQFLKDNKLTSVIRAHEAQLDGFTFLLLSQAFCFVPHSSRVSPSCVF
jgi:hypothetical protein